MAFKSLVVFYPSASLASLAGFTLGPPGAELAQNILGRPVTHEAMAGLEGPRQERKEDSWTVWTVIVTLD